MTAKLMISESSNPANCTGSLHTPATLPSDAVATTTTGGCFVFKLLSALLISGGPAKETIAPASEDFSSASKKSSALSPIWPRRIGLPTFTDLAVVI